MSAIVCFHISTSQESQILAMKPIPGLQLSVRAVKSGYWSGTVIERDDFEILPVYLLKQESIFYTKFCVIIRWFNSLGNSKNSFNKTGFGPEISKSFRSNSLWPLIPVSQSILFAHHIFSNLFILCKSKVWKHICNF